MLGLKSYKCQVNNGSTHMVIMGCILLICGCAIYLLFRSKSLNIYQWCSTMGLSSTIDSLRYRTQEWNVSEFVKYNLPDGLYSTAYILIMGAIWHNENRIIKSVIISLVPFVAITSELLQSYGIVHGTYDFTDLLCYSLPLVLYLIIISFKHSYNNKLDTQHYEKNSFINFCYGIICHRIYGL